MYPHIPANPSVTVTHSTPTADAVLTGLNVSLPSTAMKLYRLLFDTARHALTMQGHTLMPNQFVIHQPVEVMARAVGVSRVTLYKHLKTLIGLGLIASRPHKGNWFGLTRNTGTLFAVSLKPGHTARLRWLDLKHKHRDLQADTMANKSAWKFLQGLPLQSLPKVESACSTALKAWAVMPGTTSTTRLSDCKGGVADTVYALDLLPSTHKSRRAELIDRYALALATGFLDASNVNFWRKLLWDALKRDWEGLGTIHKLQSALTRLRADVDEWKQLERPGALLVHRLKQCGLWDDLKYA